MKRGVQAIVVAGWILVGGTAGVAVAQETPSAPGAVDAAESALREAAWLREQFVYAAAVQAYVYGYPVVDSLFRMHAETNAARPAAVYAPYNEFYRFGRLASPGTMAGVRAPNNDTVYFTAWLDLSQGPVIVHAPDTSDRYYTLAIADLFSETTHTGRRTTGTKETEVFVYGPSYRGTAPEGMHPVRLATHQGYILGRLLVDGSEDLPRANALVEKFSIRRAKVAASDVAEVPPPPGVPGIDPRHSLAFFDWLNEFLRQTPPAPGEASFLAQLDRIGVGPNVEFDPEKLDPATRAGLEKAIGNGHRMIRALLRPGRMPGWQYSLQVGRYGYSYLIRALVVLSGTQANVPEENVYATLHQDDSGIPLSGSKRYVLHFDAGALPPVDAFWSLSAYRTSDYDLIENPIQRYSIGDRTKGLHWNDDGSLDLYLQPDPPEEGESNWLPTSQDEYFLLLRLYQPRPEFLRGDYRWPTLRER
jgi:hypothetical protein